MLSNIPKFVFAAVIFFLLSASVQAQCPDFGILPDTETKNACFGIDDGRISAKLFGGGAGTYDASNFALYLRVGFVETGPIAATTTVINGDSVVFTDLAPAEDIIPSSIYVVKFSDPLCAGGLVFDIYTTALTRNSEILANGSTTAACTGNDGEILVAPSGGTAPYGLVWTGPTAIADDELNPTGLQSGSYDLTITDAIGCTEAFNFVVDPQPDATIASTGATTICNGSTTTVAVTINNGASPYTVSIDSAGGTKVIAGYISGTDITVGPTVSDTYTISSVTDNNGCVATLSGSVAITVEQLPTIDAGSNEQTCADTGFDISTSSVLPSGTNYTSLLWTTDGGGTFNDATALTPIYTPGGSDLAGGNVTLTLEASNTCGPVSDNMTLAVTAAPIADAGLPAETCVDLPFTVIDAAATNSAGVLWTHNGNGSLTNAATLSPTYTPDPLDAGSMVTLTLTVSGNAPCADAVDTKALNITAAATANAGAPAETCVDAAFTVVDASVTNSAGVLWTHNGNGSLTNAATLSPTYTPDLLDAGATVTLTLTVTGNLSCGNAVDTKALNITDSPTADAGLLAETCVSTAFTVTDAAATNSGGVLWTHNGNGSLTNAATLSPTYTPNALDAGTTVTLTLTVSSSGTCADAVDTKALNITDGPTADAGALAETCVDAAFTVTDATATNSGGVSWTHDGSGTLTNETTLSPTYTPDALDAGNTVTLTLTVTSTGTCPDAIDTKALDITDGPTADAGALAETCVDAAFTVTDASSTNSGGVLWTHNGNGSLTNAATLTPTYTPNALDAGSTVTLTLTVSSTGTCADAVDTKALDITATPAADAGSDESVCAGDVLDISSSSTLPTATNYMSLSWSTSGDGSFPDNSLLTPFYIPGPNDILAGTATLTLQANGNGSCVTPATDNMILTILPGPTVDAGSDEAVCIGDNFDLSSSLTPPTAANYSSLMWSTDGDGTFDDATALTPTYTPGPNDNTNGSVNLTLQANGNATCSAVTDVMTLSMTTDPTADAGSDESICSTAVFNLNSSSTPPTATNYNDLVWSTSGDGSFDDATALTPIYTPGVGDIAGGSATLTLQANGNGSCPSVTDNMTLTITPAPSQDVIISMDSITGLPSSTVFVPLRLVDYENLTTLQFTIAWDPSLLTYANVTNMNIPNMTMANFGTSQVGAGYLTFSWNTESLTDTTIADNTAIFAVEFTMANTVCSDAAVGVDLAAVAPLTPYEAVNQNGCNANAIAEGGNVENQVTSSITSSDPDNSICFGEQVIFTGAPGGMPTYKFYLNGVEVQNSGNNVYITSALVDQDSVNVIVEDAQGCSLTAQGIITDVEQITVTTNVTNISGCGLSDGAISLTVSGGSGNYSFNWTGPSIVDPTLQNQSSLAWGTYNVVVTDDVTGCTESAEEILTEPASFTLSTSKTDVSTTGGSDGAIDLTIAGGTGPFDVLWNGPNGFTSTSEDISGLFAGTYTVTVEDLGEGCTDGTVVEILQPINALVLNATKTDVTTCGASDGTINLLITGGSGSYGISWVGPNSFTSTNQNLSGLEGGVYIATVVDLVTTLTAQWVVQVDEPESFTLATAATDLSTCSGSDGAITLDVLGGSGDFSYAWRDLMGYGFTASSKDVSGLQLGNYRVVVTDNVSGCVDSTDAAVGRPAICDQPCSLYVESTTNNTSCPETADGTAVINIIFGGSGAGNYYVSLDTGATYIPFAGQDITAITNQGQGSFMYIVKDTVTGCQDTTIANIGVSTNIQANISTENPGCSEDDGVISFSLSGGLTPYDVDLIDSIGNVTSISGNGFVQFTDLTPGSYAYAIREQSGCSIVSVDSVKLVVECNTGGCSSLIASAHSFEDATCGSQPNGKAVVDVTGGSSPYEYTADGVNWIPFISGNVIDQLPADGIYNISIRQDADNPDCRTDVEVEIYGPPEIVMETPIMTVTAASCNLNDGSVKIGRVVGGTGAYNYQIDGNFIALPADSIITELGAGIHTFSVIDAVSCQADFDFTVDSPGVIVASSTDIPVSCTSLFLKAGIRIEVDLSLTTLPGPYEAYIASADDPNNGKVYQIPDNGIRTVLNLDKDFYNVTVSSSFDGGCDYSETIPVFSGASPLDFEIIDSDSIVSCIGDFGSITIGNVTGDPDTTYIVQLLSETSVILDTYEVTYFELEGGFTIDESNSTNLVAGNYYIKMIQNQVECPGVETLSGLITIYEPLANLGFEVLDDEVSLSDRPTGYIMGEVIASGGNPYEVQIQLVEPLFQMNVNDIIEFNSKRVWKEVPSTGDNLNRYPTQFDSLWAGEYEIRARDAYGCQISLEHSIGYDETVFIPNVFTPNNDGYNDTFYIRNLPESGTQVVISSRTGDVVFESDNYTLENLWDGADHADGIYYYKVIMTNGETYKGWVEKWSGSRP